MSLQGTQLELSILTQDMTILSTKEHTKRAGISDIARIPSVELATTSKTEVIPLPFPTDRSFDFLLYLPLLQDKNVFQLFGRVPLWLYMRSIQRGCEDAKDVFCCIGRVVESKCETLF